MVEESKWGFKVLMGKRKAWFEVVSKKERGFYSVQGLYEQYLCSVNSITRKSRRKQRRERE